MKDHDKILDDVVPKTMQKQILHESHWGLHGYFWKEGITEKDLSSKPKTFWDIVFNTNQWICWPLIMHNCI